MARIGIVTTPYILAPQSYVFMVQTVLSLLSQKTTHTIDLIGIVNGFRGSEAEFEWVKKTFDLVEINNQNNLSRAWNRGIAQAFDRGADYVLVINLDLAFHSQFLEHLVLFASQNPESIMWSGVEWPDQTTIEAAPLIGEPSYEAHFSCFMIDRRLPDLIGPFDEQFGPAYHEDSDMLYRLRLAKQTIMSTPSARFYHVDRATLKGAMIEKDEELLQTLRVAMDESMVRYEKKWGGLPGKEVFLVPYGY